MGDILDSKKRKITAGNSEVSKKGNKSEIDKDLLKCGVEMYAMLKQQHEELLKHYGKAMEQKMPESYLQELRSDMASIINLLNTIHIWKTKYV